ncbi:rhoptry protein ROP12 [Besnoitia besnoiti]|uniref:Rhoptry protein ROP12 n=1 Tax=Besnoitia besnoiti TaxID=94643 RepID=A0A2A9M9B5_BESBE|nr:rhoptry protein ROP12 [Besnoitia besnoiti]PFH34489.1 rhoptry protein ROP12 [Besnoitia besnoiti]
MASLCVTAAGAEAGATAEDEQRVKLCTPFAFPARGLPQQLLHQGPSQAKMHFALASLVYSASVLCLLLAAEAERTLAVRLNPGQKYVSSDEGPVSAAVARHDEELGAKAIHKAQEDEATEADDPLGDGPSVVTGEELQAGAVDASGLADPPAPIGVEIEADNAQDEEFKQEEGGAESVPNLLAGPPQTPEAVVIPAESLLAPVPGDVQARSAANLVGVGDELPSEKQAPAAVTAPVPASTPGESLPDMDA